MDSVEILISPSILKCICASVVPFWYDVSYLHYFHVTADVAVQFKMLTFFLWYHHNYVDLKGKKLAAEIVVNEK